MNRKDNTYYVALCSQLSFEATGERSGAPEGGEKTPAYYSDKTCAAWFCLKSIDRLHLDDYRREFGEPPVGDVTLYEVRLTENGALEVFPKPSWDLRPINAPGECILHLSDLHFGDSHGYEVRPHRPGTGVHTFTLSARICEGLERARYDVGIVVVAGDLITKGNASFLADFETFAEDLKLRLGITSDHFVIVPGNHDFDLITDAQEMKIDYRHESPFKRFVRSFYDNRTVQDLEQVFRFLTPSGYTIVFLALNSARLRDEESHDYGYVGAHRYEKMLLYTLNSLKEDSTVNAGVRKTIVGAVLHHHLLPVNAVELPVAKGKVSVTVDAGEIIDTLQAHGVKVALHGHQHLPFVGSINTSRPQNAGWTTPSGQPPLHVIGNGSSGAARSVLPGALPFNTYGVHRMSDQPPKLDVSFHRFLPDVPAEKLWQAALALG